MERFKTDKQIYGYIKIDRQTDKLIDRYMERVQTDKLTDGYIKYGQTNNLMNRYIGIFNRQKN